MSKTRLSELEVQLQKLKTEILKIQPEKTPTNFDSGDSKNTSDRNNILRTQDASIQKKQLFEAQKKINAAEDKLKALKHMIDSHKDTEEKFLADSKTKVLSLQNSILKIYKYLLALDKEKSRQDIFEVTLSLFKIKLTTNPEKIELNENITLENLRDAILFLQQETSNNKNIPEQKTIEQALANQNIVAFYTENQKISQFIQEQENEAAELVAEASALYIKLSGQKTGLKQDRFQNIVSNIWNRLNLSDSNIPPKSNDAKHDENIYAKYGVLKYEIKNNEGEPVEVWVYDSNCQKTTILENHALKRGLSLLEAAKSLLNDEKELSQIKTRFEERLSEIFKSKKFKNEKVVNELIHSLINDITLVWSQKNPKANENDFRKFANQLWEAVESVPSPFQRNHVLVIDKSPNVMSFEYMQRGSKKIPEGKAEGNPEIEFLSAHYPRTKPGIPNQLAYAFGKLSKNPAQSNSLHPVVTRKGFRHASFAPLHLYEMKQDNHAECVNIVTANMLAEFKEMANPHNMPCSWINVSLLTVSKKDDQNKQFRDTILAADRLRFSDSRNKPITFCFGVNWQATTNFRPRAKKYPQEQEFENQRAFFQLQKLFAEKLNIAIRYIPEDSNVRSLITHWQNLLTQQEKFEKEIENLLNPLVSAYDQALKNFENGSPAEKEALRLKVQIAEDLLNKKKKIDLYARANELFTSYKDKYKDVEKTLHDFLIAADHKRVNEIRLFSQGLNSESEPYAATEFGNLIQACKDFEKIHSHILDDTWRDQPFELQAYLIDLASHLDELDPTSQVESSWNCKSNNDRSAVLAAYVNQQRAIYDFAEEAYRHKIDITPVIFDIAEYCLSMASIFHTTIDTQGGGNKFGGRAVVHPNFDSITDPGHPNTKMAVLLEKTSQLATHKMAEKYTGDKLITATNLIQKFLLEVPLNLATREERASTADNAAVREKRASTSDDATTRPSKTSTSSSSIIRESLSFAHRSSNEEKGVEFDDSKAQESSSQTQTSRKQQAKSLVGFQQSYLEVPRPENIKDLDYIVRALLTIGNKFIYFGPIQQHPTVKVMCKILNNTNGDSFDKLHTLVTDKTFLTKVIEISILNDEDFKQKVAEKPFYCIFKVFADMIKNNNNVLNLSNPVKFLDDLALAYPGYQSLVTDLKNQKNKNNTEANVTSTMSVFKSASTETVSHVRDAVPDAKRKLETFELVEVQLKQLIKDMQKHFTSKWFGKDPMKNALKCLDVHNLGPQLKVQNAINCFKQKVGDAELVEAYSKLYQALTTNEKIKGEKECLDAINALKGNTNPTVSNETANRGSFQS